MASPQIQTLAAAIRAQIHARPAGTPPDVAAMRTAYDEATAQMGLGLAEGATVAEVDAAGVPCEWVATPSSRADRALLYLHGGGYVLGSRRSHRPMLSRIAAAGGVRVLSADYRLAPEHRHPAAVDDAVAAWRWLLASGVSPAHAAIGGDSAGGGLTVAALVAIRDAGYPLPAAAVCLSPWADLEVSGESARRNAEKDPMVRLDDLSHWVSLYVPPGVSPRAPLASPLHASLKGLPPMLVHVAKDEVLHDDATRLAARAREAGVDVTLDEWDGVFHVWHFFAGIAPEADEAVARVGRFLQSKLADA
jgi:phosphinothricin tripeptide acetyl hydrolase